METRCPSKIKTTITSLTSQNSHARTLDCSVFPKRQKPLFRTFLTAKGKESMPWGTDCWTEREKRKRRFCDLAKLSSSGQTQMRMFTGGEVRSRSGNGVNRSATHRGSHRRRIRRVYTHSHVAPTFFLHIARAQSHSHIFMRVHIHAWLKCLKRFVACACR